MSVPRGLVWYCGKTQVGKTVHALKMGFAAKDAGAGPILVIDSQGAKNFTAWPRARDRRQLYERIYGYKRDCAYTPDDSEDVERIFNVVRERGRCTVLLDEASFWINRRKLPRLISKALRAWFHSGVLYLFTTQRFFDIHADALAVDCTVRVYQTNDGPDTDRLWDEKRIKPEQVTGLPVGSFLTMVNGTVQRGGDGCPTVTHETA